jgi:hypothetical protein
MRGRGTAEAPSLPGCTPQLVGVSHWSSTPTKLRTLNHRVRPRHGHASAKRRERWGGVSRRLQVVPLHQTLCHRSSEPPEGSAQPGGGGELLRPRGLPCCHPRATTNMLCPPTSTTSCDVSATHEHVHHTHSSPPVTPPVLMHHRHTRPLATTTARSDHERGGGAVEATRPPRLPHALHRPHDPPLTNQYNHPLFLTW